MNSASADAYIEEESFPKSPITAALYRDPALAQWAEPGGLTVSFYYNFILDSLRTRSKS